MATNPFSPPRNASEILSVVLLNPKKQFSVGSRYFQASSLARSTGMLWENTTISSLSLASGSTGKLLIAFSNIMRRLPACVSGTGDSDAVLDAIVETLIKALLETGPEEPGSMVYAIMGVGVGTVGGMRFFGCFVKKYRSPGCLERPDLHTTFHMPETPAQSPPPSPPFLPTHQTDAIHAFFNRLQLAQTNIDECAICHKCFHGIHMQGSVYDRCSREVCALFPPLQLLLLSTYFTCSTAFIGFPRRTTLTPASFLPTCVPFWTVSPRWRRCCAALHLPAFSCGSTKEASTKVAGTLLLSPKTSHHSALLSPGYLKTST